MEEIIIIEEKTLDKVILESAKQHKIIKEIEYKNDGTVSVRYYNDFQKKMMKM